MKTTVPVLAPDYPLPPSKVRRLYVASSWRNPHQPGIVDYLRGVLGYEVYDFRQPTPGDNGFHWSEIDKDWQEWNLHSYIRQLKHPVAEAGFRKDFDAMKWADGCLLVLPCGRSAHLEAGWFIGQGKPCVILSPPEERLEPELMNKMATAIVGTLGDAHAVFQRTGGPTEGGAR